MNYKILQYDTIDSTNKEAKRLASLGEPEGTVVLSKSQSAGKGRSDHLWYSPENGGLYMSMILRPEKIDELSKLTIMAGVAVSSVLDAKIKWINDIILNGKKACGILAESSLSHNETGDFSSFVIVGIGVNLLNESFPNDLSDKATSVYLETGKRLDILSIAEKICNSLCYEYKNIKSGNFNRILNDYISNCVTVGQEVRFTTKNGFQYGKAIGIDSEGGLIVKTRTDSESVTLRSSEVSVRTANGRYI